MTFLRRKSQGGGEAEEGAATAVRAWLRAAAGQVHRLPEPRGFVFRLEGGYGEDGGEGEGEGEGADWVATCGLNEMRAFARRWLGAARDAGAEAGGGAQVYATRYGSPQAWTLLQGQPARQIRWEEVLWVERASFVASEGGGGGGGGGGGNAQLVGVCPDEAQARLQADLVARWRARGGADARADARAGGVAVLPLSAVSSAAATVPPGSTVVISLLTACAQPAEAALRALADRDGIRVICLAPSYLPMNVQTALLQACPPALARRLVELPRAAPGEHARVVLARLHLSAEDCALQRARDPDPKGSLWGLMSLDADADADSTPLARLWAQQWTESRMAELPPGAVSWAASAQTAMAIEAPWTQMDATAFPDDREPSRACLLTAPEAWRSLHMDAVASESSSSSSSSESTAALVLLGGWRDVETARAALGMGGDGAGAGVAWVVLDSAEPPDVGAVLESARITSVTLWLAPGAVAGEVLVARALLCLAQTRAASVWLAPKFWCNSLPALMALHAEKQRQERLLREESYPRRTLHWFAERMQTEETLTHWFALSGVDRFSAGFAS